LFAKWLLTMELVPFGCSSSFVEVHLNPHHVCGMNWGCTENRCDERPSPTRKALRDHRDEASENREANQGMRRPWPVAVREQQDRCIVGLSLPHERCRSRSWDRQVWRRELVRRPQHRGRYASAQGARQRAAGRATRDSLAKSQRPLWRTSWAIVSRPRISEPRCSIVAVR
jgi:hypothetical protein